MNRVELKNKAKELLKGNVFRILGVILLVGLITYVVKIIPGIFGIKTSEVIGNSSYGVQVTKTTSFGYIWNLVSAIVSAVLNVGLTNYILKFIRNENPTISDIFDIIKEKISIIIPVGILCSIFISLGFICLIIPGIIVALILSQVSYIIVDEDNLDTMAILKKSADMMNGHKGEYFILGLSFIGWILLCMFIIPIIYVIPYTTITFALYYENLKKQTN